MSHHVITDTDPGRPGMTALVIRGEDAGKRGELRVSRASRGHGGLHFKVRHGAVAEVTGEDFRAFVDFVGEVLANEPLAPYADDRPEMREPEWHPGDHVLGAHYFYIRQDDEKWQPFTREGSRTGRRFSDSHMAYLIRTAGARPVTKRGEHV